MTAYQVSLQLDALGDATRRAIFQRLARGPLAVVDIARDLPVSRPAVSQHLKVLKDVGLVMDRAEGTRRLYQVDPEGLAAVRRYFDDFWNQALGAFAQAAEQDRPQAEPREADKRTKSKRGKKRRTP